MLQGFAKIFGESESLMAGKYKPKKYYKKAYKALKRGTAVGRKAYIATPSNARLVKKAKKPWTKPMNAYKNISSPQIVQQAFPVGAPSGEDIYSRLRRYVGMIVDPVNNWAVSIPRKYPVGVVPAVGHWYGTVGPKTLSGTDQDGYGTSYGLIIGVSRYAVNTESYMAATQADTFTARAIINGSSLNGVGALSPASAMLESTAIKSLVMRFEHTGPTIQSGGVIYVGTIPRGANSVTTTSLITSTSPSVLMGLPTTTMYSVADIMGKKLFVYGRKISVSSENFIDTSTDADDYAIPFVMWAQLPNNQGGTANTLNSQCFNVDVMCSYDAIPNLSYTGGQGVSAASLPVTPPSDDLPLYEIATGAIGRMQHTSSLFSGGVETASNYFRSTYDAAVEGFEHASQDQAYMVGHSLARFGVGALPLLYQAWRAANAARGNANVEGVPQLAGGYRGG